MDRVSETSRGFGESYGVKQGVGVWPLASLRGPRLHPAKCVLGCGWLHRSWEQRRPPPPSPQHTAPRPPRAAGGPCLNRMLRAKQVASYQLLGSNPWMKWRTEGRGLLRCGFSALTVASPLEREMSSRSAFCLLLVEKPHSLCQCPGLVH